MESVPLLSGDALNLLAWDTESHLIQPGLLAPPIVCGSFAGPGGFQSLLDRERTLMYVEGCLASTTTVWTGANIAYDWGCVLAARPDLLPLVWKAYEEGRVYDVLIGATLDALYAGRLRDGELYRKDGTKIQSGRYSLKEVVSEYLGRDDAKANDRWRESYALLDGIPLSEWPEDARQYPIDDAVNTLLVAEAQLKSAQNLHDMPTQAHAALCYHLGSIWGLRTDAASVEKLKIQVEQRLAQLRATARANGFIKVGGTKAEPKDTKDTKAIREAVFKAYAGLPPTTPKGEVSTSREALEESNEPALESLAEVSKWEKLQTYLPVLEQASTRPLCVSANVLLATGRSSYSGLLQLMPRKGGVRECFHARPGTVWSSVDYAAIEMSTLAQVQLWALGRSTLADAINDGVDPHSLFAAGMVGESYDKFRALVKAKDAVASGLRQAAKAANFGFPGMMGAAKFVVAKRREGASVCEWLYRDGQCGSEGSGGRIREWKGRDLDAPLCKRCIEEAEKLRGAYLRQWPEMQPYWTWVQAEMGYAERVEQFVSKRVRGGVSGPAGANTYFQGLAADGAKRALIALTREMYLDRASPLYGSRLMLMAHDESILEIPEERAHEAAMRQAEVMVAAMKTCVPDVKVSAEPALMRVWSKNAVAKYREGKLIPFDDAA